MRMIESGELRKITTKYLEKEPDCDGSKGRSLGFLKVGIAFVVFVFGIILCLVLLIIEIFIGKYKTHKALTQNQLN